MERINYPVLAFLLFFISVFFIVLVLIPRYQILSNLKKSLSQWERALEDQREYFNAVEEDLKKLGNYQAQIEKVSLAIPKSPFLPSFFNLIEALASANGLILKDIGASNVSQSEKIPGLKEIETSFTLSGSYFALKNFVSGLESSARMVEIENISFKVPTLPGKIPAEGIFDFSFRVKFYSL